MNESGANSEAEPVAGSPDSGGGSPPVNFTVGEVLREAWGRVAGNKATVWAAVGLYLLAAVALALVFYLITGEPPVDENGQEVMSPITLLERLLATLILAPVWAGTMLVGVAIASGHLARPASVLSWYSLTLKLFFTYVLMGLMIGLGFLLLILPGIYLAVSYQFALAMAADKNLGPWEALEASRKAVTPRWFTYFGLDLLGGLAFMASVFLLGVPLIWIVPALLIGFGILYRNTVGAEPETLRQVAGEK